jgi:hypothetical protein
MAQNLKKPTQAPSMKAAAAVLQIPKRIIQTAKNHGCPAIHPSGRVDLEALELWLKEHPGVSELGAKAATLDALKARNMLLQNERLEFDLSVAQCVHVSDELVQTVVGEHIGDAKRILLQGPSSLAPQLVGLTVPEAQKLITEWIERALSQLAPLTNRSIYKPKA